MNKGYAVVEFLSEMVDNQPLVQEVPANWLCHDNTMCWWPPKNSHKEIRGATNPDATTWQKYDVRVKKVYEDLSKARQRCLIPSDMEEEEMGKHRRRRKETYKLMFHDTSDSPPPQPPSSCGVMADSHYNDNEDSSEAPYPYPELFDLTTKNQSTENPITEMMTQSQNCLDPSKMRAPPSKSPSNESKASFDEIKNCLIELKDEINSMRRQMQEVILHVTNIEEVLELKLKGKSDLNKKFNKIFPLTNENEFKQLVEALDNDTQLVEELKIHFNTVGGSGPKDHHARIFKLVFSNELGMKCSWKGMRGNIKLENVNFITACMCVLRQVWKTTDKEFEVFSQEWLRHCAQRKKREEAKK